MNISEAIKQLDGLDDDDVIFVRQPWTPHADCVVAKLDEEYRVPSSIVGAGFEYFLEIAVAREVLEVFGDRVPTDEEKLRLVMHYAEHDAYPEWAAQDSLA
jgi:hypothetical protein